MTQIARRVILAGLVSAGLPRWAQAKPRPKQAMYSDLYSNTY